MVAGPKAGDETTPLHFVYDAWNRMTGVYEDTDEDGQLDLGGENPDEPVALYRYDATGRRILKQLVDAEDPDEYVHFYHSGQQVVETREGDDSGGVPDPNQLPPKHQFVWSPRYIDSLILRDENKNGDATCTGTGDERLFYLADANYNVTAVVAFNDQTETWHVAERYLYDPYGRVTILNGDTAVDPDGQSYAEWSADPDGKSDVANTTLYTGRELDPETGVYYYRQRIYHPTLAGFLTRDPLSYSAGDANLYRYVGNSPTAMTDPTGLSPLTIAMLHELGLLPGPPAGQGGQPGAGAAAAPPLVVRWIGSDAAYIDAAALNVSVSIPPVPNSGGVYIAGQGGATGILNCRSQEFGVFGYLGGGAGIGVGPSAGVTNAFTVGIGFVWNLPGPLATTYSGAFYTLTGGGGVGLGTAFTGLGPAALLGAQVQGFTADPRDFFGARRKPYGFEAGWRGPFLPEAGASVTGLGYFPITTVFLGRNHPLVLMYCCPRNAARAALPQTIMAAGVSSMASNFEEVRGMARAFLAETKKHEALIKRRTAEEAEKVLVPVVSAAGGVAGGWLTRLGLGRLAGSPAVKITWGSVP